MSYQGYTPLMVDYLDLITKIHRIREDNRSVRILEIGVDRGQTSLILMSSLIARDIPFVWTGVDIRSDACLTQQITLMEGVDHYRFKKVSNVESFAVYVQENSLDFLRKNQNVYDLVLIDGDHNYDTVSEELSHLERITHEFSLVICDDYEGRHSGKDSFYADYESHKALKGLSKNLEKDKNKGGVKAAIDEFMVDNGTFLGCHDPHFEVFFVCRKLGFDYELLENIAQDGKALFHPLNFKCNFFTQDGDIAAIIENLLEVPPGEVKLALELEPLKTAAQTDAKITEKIRVNFS